MSRALRSGLGMGLMLALILALALPVFASGDHHGNKGKEKKIEICHFPPGNRGNPQVIEISKSAWDKHKKHHGDFKIEDRHDRKKCKPKDSTTTTTTTYPTTTSTVADTTTTTTGDGSTTTTIVKDSTTTTVAVSPSTTMVEPNFPPPSGPKFSDDPNFYCFDEDGNRIAVPTYEEAFPICGGAQDAPTTTEALEVLPFTGVGGTLPWVGLSLLSLGALAHLFNRGRKEDSIGG